MTKETQIKKDCPNSFRILVILLVITWFLVGILTITTIKYTNNIKSLADENATATKKIQTVLIKSEMVSNKVELLNKRIDQLSGEIDMVLNTYLPESKDLIKKAYPDPTSQDAPETETDETTDTPESEATEVEKYEPMAFDNNNKDISAGLDDVSNRTDELEKKLDKVNDELKKNSQNSLSGNLILSAVRLRDAVNDYRAFTGELDIFKSAAKDNTDESLKQNIETLEKYAKDGAPSVEELRMDFDSVADAITNYNREQKPEPTLLDKLAVEFSGLVKVRKINDNAMGTETPDILARTYNYLMKSDVQKAVEEANKLPDGAKAIANPWLEKAEANIESKKASEDIFVYVSHLDT